jgi:hypothetical protein
LTETLLPKFVDNNNEEIFECLKESIEEDYEFCEKLIELCPNKVFLVKFCQQREEKYDSILEKYEERPTLNST